MRDMKKRCGHQRHETRKNEKMCETSTVKSIQIWQILIQSSAIPDYFRLENKATVSIPEVQQNISTGWTFFNL